MPKRESKSDKSAFEQKSKIASKVDPEAEAFISALLDAEEDVYRKDQFRKLIMQTDVKELEEIAEELFAREMESLELFEPMVPQQAFLKSKKRIRIVRGGNRSGKTLITHVEMARVLTGRHPEAKEPGEFYMVGADEKHLGDPMWKKLAGWGPFNIIKDPVTKKWRAFNYINRYDRENPKLAKPAPPLIPPRFIPKDGIAWIKKRRLIPSQVKLTTGWVLSCYSSRATPPKGFACHWGLFDEEIEGEEWYPEMMRGLVDYGGRFIWGATPQAQTEKLFELHERATDPMDGGVAEFVLRTLDNAHLSEQSKKDFHDDLSPAERSIRLDGNFALSEIHVYPEFSANYGGPHGIDSFVIPVDWSIYVAVDPGTQVCAVLFAAVPPGQKHLHFFDELYIRRATPEQCATQIRHVLQERMPEIIIFDHQMGQYTEVGSGRQVEWFYAEEFKKAGIRSRQLGYEFLWGSTDVSGREQALRKLLTIRGSTGDAKLRVHRRCENFIWEMSRQRYKPKTNRSQRIRKHDHLVACAEYIADFDPQWVDVPPPPPPESSVEKARKYLQQLHRMGESSSFRSLGPVGPKKGAA